jgi:hypothetical protein
MKRRSKVGILYLQAQSTAYNFSEPVEGAAALATFYFLLRRFFEILIGFFTNLFDCSGLAIADHIVYAPDFLNNMTKDQKIYDNKNRTYPALNSVSCGRADSVYAVSYCLERLDAKTSIAVSLLPGTLLVWTSFTLALVCGGYSSFL